MEVEGVEEVEGLKRELFYQTFFNFAP